MLITILEDDSTLRFALEKHFTELGFEVRLYRSLQDAFTGEIHDGLYLVDVSLPDGEGFDYGEIVSQNKQAYLIYLTVRDDQRNIIKGFETGSDDYITKPFSFIELDKRVEALVKRHKPRILTFNDVTIDTELAQVKVGNEELYLSVQEYRILRLLIDSAPHTVSREVLNESLNIIEETQDGLLNVAIARLRKKLKGHIKIEAVIKEGYKLKL